MEQRTLKDVGRFWTPRYGTATKRSRSRNKNADSAVPSDNIKKGEKKNIQKTRVSFKININISKKIKNRNFKARIIPRPDLAYRKEDEQSIMKIWSKSTGLLAFFVCSFDRKESTVPINQIFFEISRRYFMKIFTKISFFGRSLLNFFGKPFEDF